MPELAPEDGLPLLVEPLLGSGEPLLGAPDELPEDPELLPDVNTGGGTKWIIGAPLSLTPEPASLSTVLSTVGIIEEEGPQATAKHAQAIRVFIVDWIPYLD
jgi:hypothetical protein